MKLNLLRCLFLGLLIHQSGYGSGILYKHYSEKLVGYVDHVSYDPGDSISVKISSFFDSCYVYLIRQSLVPDTILVNECFGLGVQTLPENAFEIGCHWKESFKFQLPRDLKSDYYTITLRNGGEFFNIPLIVRSRTLDVSEKICVIASSNTWLAYNLFGGGGIYGVDKYSSDIHLVSKSRPNFCAQQLDYTGHLFGAELGVTHGLEKLGYDVEVISDEDLHAFFNILNGYKAVVISTHSEYWSHEMRFNLESFLSNQGRLCSLSGNTMYYRVSFHGDQMEVRKNGGIHSQDGLVGGKWSEIAPYKSEDWFLGVRYVELGGYETFAPYEVSNKDHWLFNGTGVENGDVFGVSLNGGGASGIEMDKIGACSPHNLKLLACGQNNLDKEMDTEGAWMVYYDHPCGGAVFSVGSISFGGSLLVDSICSKILTNFLDAITTSTDDDCSTFLPSQDGRDYKSLLILGSVGIVTWWKYRTYLFIMAAVVMCAIFFFVINNVKVKYSVLCGTSFIVIVVYSLTGVTMQMKNIEMKAMSESTQWSGVVRNKFIENGVRNIIIESNDGLVNVSEFQFDWNGSWNLIRIGDSLSKMSAHSGYTVHYPCFDKYYRFYFGV